MPDERESTLARYDKELHPEKYRDPQLEREAKIFADRVGELLTEQFAQVKQIRALVDYDEHFVDVLFSSLKWYLPTTIRTFLDTNGKIVEAKRLRAQLAADPNLPRAERNEKIRKVDQRIAGYRKTEDLVNTLFSMAVHGWDANAEDREMIDRGGAVIVALSRLVRLSIARAQLRVDVDGVDQIPLLLIPKGFKLVPVEGYQATQ